LSRRRVTRTLITLLLAAAAIVAAGIYTRHRAQAQLVEKTHEDAAASVTVAHAFSGSAVDTFTLPGNVTAWSDAPVYARTSGYLIRWHYDIGARVKKGALLAEISAPEVDQQVAQAAADLATAQATARNASMQAERYNGLITAEAVTRQDADTYTNLANSTSSAVRSAQANLARLKQLQSFERVYAPFDGVVTARNIDNGQLVAEGPANELFHIQTVDKLRVYTNIPEEYSAGIRVGQSVSMTLAEYPGKAYQGTITRTSQVIDPASRTLLVEIDVPNPKGELKPGALAQIHFKEPHAIPTYILPVSAVIFRGDGTQVATVKSGGKVHLQQVMIGQDNGATVQVLAGIGPDDAVIQDPPDSLIEGTKVRIVAAKSQRNEARVEQNGDSPAGNAVVQNDARTHGGERNN
jgi:RND family efflux transporter MFP subunit